MFTNLKLTNHAKTAQIELKNYMLSLGYKCILEYNIKDRYDGKSGRIDLVCFKDNEIIAIEIDNVSPRQKSIYKLKNFNQATRRYVVCRNGKYFEIKGD